MEDERKEFLEEDLRPKTEEEMFLYAKEMIDRWCDDVEEFLDLKRFFRFMRFLLKKELYDRIDAYIQEKTRTKQDSNKLDSK